MQRVWDMLIVILAAASGAADPPRLALRTVDRADLVGELLALSANEGMVIRDDTGERIVVPLGELIEARPTSSPGGPDAGGRERSPAGWPRVFAMHDGQRVVGTIVDADAEQVTIYHPQLGRVRVRVEGLAWIGRPGGGAGRTRLLRECQEAEKTAGGQLDADTGRPGPSDCVALLNGDVVRGRIVGLGAEHVLIDDRARELKVAWDKVARIAFGAAAAMETQSGARGCGGSASTTRPAGSGRWTTETVLELGDGSRLIGADIRYRAGDGTFCCPAGEGTIRWRVAVAADRVTRIAVRGGRWEWLSEVCPVEITSGSMFGLDFPPLRGRNVLGGALSVNGRTCERGVGVHASCGLTYALDGAYERFVSQFGIDDDSGEWADVDVRVEVDGRTRFSAEHVRRGDERGAIDVDVTGARRLELIVTAGANGDVQDRFDWVDGGLVRALPSGRTQPLGAPPGHR